MPLLTKYLSLCSLLAALLLGIFFIKNILLGGKSDFEGAKGSTPYFPQKNNLSIHIRQPDSLPRITMAYSLYGKGQSLILWLGNSQLHLINQYQEGQKNSVEYLHDTLQRHNQFVVGFSMINANLQELYIVFGYLLHKIKINKVLVPVFFDDLRESGIRAELIKPDIFRVLASDNDSSWLGKAIRSRYILLTDSTGKNKGPQALNNTVQEHVEGFLDKELSEISPTWSSRGEMRGKLIYDYLYKARNTVFSIKPSSKRKKIEANYILNMAAFDKICTLAMEHSVELVAYIPPTRNDIDQPYIKEEYDDFKVDLTRYQEKHGFLLYNAESVVPPQFWGLKSGTRVDNDLEVDFMHFQSEGHRLLSDSLAPILTRKPAVE